MSPDEKQRFADGFLQLYLSMGLGTLPKREIDLFVFHFLTTSSEHRGKSNYALANEFGVPESRIKSLRLNSALRYEDINPRAVLSRIVDRLIHSEQFASLDEGKIEISLEDPVEKRELEHYLKQGGYHAEYSLNSEVLKISAGRLLELILEHADNANEEFNQLIRQHISDSAVSSRILSDAPTLKQKLDKLRAENLNLSTLKALISAGFGLL